MNTKGSKVLSFRSRSEVPKRVERRRSISVPADCVKNEPQPIKQASTNTVVTSRNSPEQDLVIYTKQGVWPKKILFDQPPLDRVLESSRLRIQGKHLGTYFRFALPKETLDALIDGLLSHGPKSA